MWLVGLGLLGVAWVLCKLKPTVQLYVKFLTYYTFMSASAVVVMFLSMLSPGNANNFRYLIPPFGVCSLLLGIRAELRDLHNLESDKPYILVSNHQSSLDFIGVSMMIPRRCTFLAKKELLYAGPFGLACWLCGCIFIDRMHHESAISTMVNTASTIKRKNVIVWIFPEGKRNPKKGLQPFKKGAFHLAVQAQVPVVPVVFSGYHFYEKKKRLDAGRFTITALPPVSTAGLTGDDVGALTEDIRQRMLDVYNKTTS
ncbi:1-acyl-sn-glycerol-3-phosphate acyltransferase alpha-like [Haliotis cracherodii]|uniref:1-acyl-sn-glycerol-3-phosphate acyltransferase alpha-like n=1 Tax=Haliotis cracherodii TaxID=6455 RepID=UPI0039E868C9